ncbi:MAG: UDP-N-acetylglucosamine 2-epimerase, partial [Eubacteriales bacterium]
VIQLGEQPDRVFCVGALGVENIKNMPLLSKEQLEREIDFSLQGRFALVTFHPVTLENNTTEQQFEKLLSALDATKDLKIVFTKANADTEGRTINSMIDAYADKNKDRAIAFTSMGQLKYLSAMKYADAVIGNSSSGIVEGPALCVPTVNIGDRQKGRIMGESIVNCAPERKDIIKAINLCLSAEFKNKIKSLQSPYGQGDTSCRIADIIKDFLYNNKIDLKKHFYDL